LAAIVLSVACRLVDVVLGRTLGAAAVGAFWLATGAACATVVGDGDAWVVERCAVGVWAASVAATEGVGFASARVTLGVVCAVAVVEGVGSAVALSD